MVHMSIDQGAARLAPMGAEHLAQAHGLSAALKWPYRLEDWAFALDLGHGLVMVRDGVVLGTALWWLYGRDIASVGMVIVSPDARRQGIGGRLMAGVMAALAGRRVVLNATAEGLPLYQRLGFLPRGGVCQHQAVLPAAVPVHTDATVRPFLAADLPALTALDLAGSGMDRAWLIDALLAIGQVMVLERDGAVRGYGCVRVWGRGLVIGPVVAHGAGDARALIAALAAGCQGRFLRVDVTRESDLSPWLEAIGLPQVDEVAAMARGAPPLAREGAAIFALSNQSLG